MPKLRNKLGAYSNAREAAAAAAAAAAMAEAAEAAAEAAAISIQMPEWATQNHIQCDVILSKLKPIYGVD